MLFGQALYKKGTYKENVVVWMMDDGCWMDEI